MHLAFSFLLGDLGQNLFGNALQIVELFRFTGARDIDNECFHPLVCVRQEILDDFPGCPGQRTRRGGREVQIRFWRDLHRRRIAGSLCIQRLQPLTLFAKRMVF